MSGASFQATSCLGKARFTALTAVCSLLLVLIQTNTTFAQESVPGEYIIKFREKTVPSSQVTMRRGLGVELLRQSELTRTELVKAPSGEFDDNYAKELLASGAVQYIEPNYIIHIDGTPSDPKFSELWGLHNTGASGSADVDIDGPEAWNLTEGSDSVVVGIVDTGINITHPDLVSNLWRNPGETPNNGVDDDGNGVIDDLYGFNAITRTGNPNDDNSHGSHVAGTIGATANNGQGVVGVNWKVKLMGLKFLSASGSGTTQAAIDAIQYAVMMRQRGVNIRALNNSWGGGGYSQALADAISAATNAGILFVAAAGNSSSDNDSVPIYPASYDIPGVISVAAVDSNGNLASFSNYGTSSVDLAAPGVKILSTVLSGGYASYNGTSMATPHVTGVAALLSAYDPSLSATALKSRLMNTVKPLSTLNGQMLAPGIVSAYRALTNSLTPTPPAGRSVAYEKSATAFAPSSELGSRVLNSDDGYVAVDLGFSFPYFRIPFSRVAISANGRVIPLAGADGPPSTPDYSNRLSSGINPYHDDLFPNPLSTEGGVWLRTDGAAAYITWDVVSYAHRTAPVAAAPIKFQLILRQSGEIEFHYIDTTTGAAAYDAGGSATVGIVPPLGIDGERLLVSTDTNNSPELGDGHSLSFVSQSLESNADFDGDGKSDLPSFNYSTGRWHVLLSSTSFLQSMRFSFGKKLQPLIGDFDGDGRADIAAWNRKNGIWSIRLSSQGWTRTKRYIWGRDGDMPLVSDLDFDGRSDLVIYRPSRAAFLALKSSRDFAQRVTRSKKTKKLEVRVPAEAQLKVKVGIVKGTPVMGDLTGDGRDDVVVVDRKNQNWLVKTTSSQNEEVRQWGSAGDTPLSCDWDGDGRGDRVSVHSRDDGVLEWRILNHDNTTQLFEFGRAGDRVGCRSDFDGDGASDLVIYSPQSGLWMFRSSLTGESSSYAGLARDAIPLW